MPDDRRGEVMACPTCAVTVVPMDDGSCPACAATIAPSRLVHVPGLDLGIGFAIPESGLAQALMGGVLIACVCLYAPHIEPIFRENRFTLPGISEWMIQISLAPAIALAGLFAWPFITGIVVHLLGRTRKRIAPVAWIVVTWMVFASVTFLLVTCMFMPLFKIFNEMHRSSDNQPPTSPTPSNH